VFREERLRGQVSEPLVGGLAARVTRPNDIGQSAGQEEESYDHKNYHGRIGRRSKHVFLSFLWGECSVGRIRVFRLTAFIISVAFRIFNGMIC